MKVIARSVLFLVGLVVMGLCVSPQIDTPVSQSPDLPETSTVEPAQNVYGEGMFTIDLPTGWNISSE